MRQRKVEKILQAQPVMEGAGVKLKRAFGYHQAPALDPFLLLDDIHSTDPGDYTPGFPWHPHRGIETVTYVLRGRVEHGDSLGNSGAIESGDVQWMTAGSGIIHQEMPRKWSGDMRGLQLWVNLPAADKMMGPRYRDIPAGSIPTVEAEGGCTVKVIAGSYNGTRGPVQDLVLAPDYLDVAVPAGGRFTWETGDGRQVLAYVLEGSGRAGQANGQDISSEQAVVFSSGDKLALVAGDAGLRLLLISGTPLDEPVAWAGPIVMNTRRELEDAFREYREGTFLR